jgi:hypothetical protein
LDVRSSNEEPGTTSAWPLAIDAPTYDESVEAESGGGGGDSRESGTLSGTCQRKTV